MLSGGPTGSHKIEGIGIGFMPPLWEPDPVDEIQTVTTDEASPWPDAWHGKKGCVAGASSGANVVASLRVAERLGPDSAVVTILRDSRLCYLSTDLYRET